MSVNPFIKVIMEDVNESIETTEGNYGSEQVMDVSNDSLLVNEIINDVDSLSIAEQRMTEIQNVQNQNLQSIENNQEVFKPIDGGFQEPLPEDGDESVSIIGDQMYKEQLVIENVAGILGFMTDKSSSGTSKLYKTLGVRTSPYTPKDIKLESFGERNKKIKAIAVYKSHCEGIGDVISKLSSSVWEGIKKMIERIIELFKKIISGAKNMFSRFDKVEDKVNTFQNRENAKEGSGGESIELSDEIKNGIKDLQEPEHVILDLENPMDLLDNASIILEGINNGRDMEIDEFLKSGKFSYLKFKSAKFNGDVKNGVLVNKYEVACFNGDDIDFVECESINLKFNSARELLDIVNLMVRDGKSEFKKQFEAWNNADVKLKKISITISNIESKKPLLGQKEEPLSEEIMNLKRMLPKVSKTLLFMGNTIYAYIRAAEFGLKHIIEVK